MKLILIAILFLSFSAQACTVYFETIQVTEEEQTKGPLKVTRTVLARYLLDGPGIDTFQAITDESREPSGMTITNKNKTTIELGYYDEKLFNNIMKQIIKCKG